MIINLDQLSNNSRLLDIIENRFTENLKIEKIPPDLWIERDGEEVHLGAKGEVTVFFGMPKSGKSIVLELICGTLLCNEGCIGPIKKSDRLKDVIYLDLEQSPSEWAVAMNRVMRYADINKVEDNFLSLCMTSESVSDRFRYLKELLPAVSNVDVVIIDGVADLIDSDSDSNSSKSSSEELKALAVKHDCLIISILHTDKKGKGPRDHLGSKYEKIASTLVKVEKQEGTNMFSLQPYMSRHTGVWEQINFFISSETKMVDFRSVQKSEEFKGANFVNRKKDAIFDSEEVELVFGSNIDKAKNLHELFKKQKENDES